MFAVKPIKRRASIVAYRGPLLTEEEADRYEARDSRYLFILNKKWTIDGSPRWNLGRYANHSCRPNAEPISRNGGIHIVALRRIEPGEEITYDYGKDYRAYFFKGRRHCLCQACRERVARRRRKMRAVRKLAAERASRKKTSPGKAARNRTRTRTAARKNGRTKTARRR